MRVCSICGLEKSEDKFYKHKLIKPDGIRKQCKDCRQEYRRKAHAKNPEIKRRQAKEWADKNRDKLNADARQKRAANIKRFKGYALKADFGLCIEEFDRMVNEQNNLCKLCGRPETTKHQSGKTKDLAVDHDHLTGKIRGLLCWVCNTGIGKLQDSPELLRKAADYIENSRR